MLKRKIMFLAIFLVSLLAVSAVCATENVTEDIVSEDAADGLAVNENQIILEVNESSTGNFDDLSGEIGDVEDGGVLNLTRDYKFVNGSRDGIIINKNITINGNSHIIDGNAQSRLFRTFNGNIILNDLVLVNGFADKGGAILVNKTVNCNNVVFENNRAEEGGAIYTMLGINLDNCVFNGGYAKTGAAIYAFQLPEGDGGSSGEDIPTVDVNVSDDEFNDTMDDSNGTDDEFNGTDSGSGDMQIDDLNPEDFDFPEPREDEVNTEIEFEDYDYGNPFCLVSNSVFKNFDNVQLALMYAGYNQRIGIFNSTFANSTSQYATAIYTEGMSNNLVNNTFANLHASKSGGAIGFNVFLMLNIANSTFDNVTCENNGGAICADGQGWLFGMKAEITISNSQFRNSKGKYGAAIALLGAKLYLADSSFIDCYAQYNGAIYSSRSEMKIVNSTFANNRLNMTDDVTKAMMYMYRSTLIMNGSQFTDNSNGIFALHSVCNISGTVFKDNGRALYAMDPVLMVLDGNDYNNDTLVENASGDGFYVITVNSTGVKLDPVENDIDVENLPPYFNSADWGWVTVPKDQWISGACWVFSTCAALESALLKSTGVEYNLSTQNIQKNILGYAIYGSSWMAEGGFPHFAANYILSWYGALPAEYDEFDMVGKATVPIISSDAIHVQDVLWLSPRTGDLDIDEIKRTVLKYGAVTAEMHADYDSVYFNRNTSASYCNETAFTSVNHAVCIVGWDDNYLASNFRITPPGNGAWIVKNSYGTESYDHGYIYISYYDTVLNNDSTEVAFILDNTEAYTKNYQTDIGGDINIKSMSENYTYKNSYVAIEDDFISAVGTYFNKKGEDYVLEIYVNDELKYNQTDVAPFRGYHTIRLNDYVPIRKGDVFTLLIRTHSMPLITKSNVPFRANVSFATNGTGWIDLSSIGATVSLKAYTKPLVNLTTTIVSDGVKTRYGSGEYLVVTVRDVYGDAIEGVNVTAEFSQGISQTLVSDSKGQVKFSTEGLAPKAYVAAISTPAFDNYVMTNSTVNVVVKKAKTKLAAKKATFKANAKSKKLKVSLKSSKNRAVKKAKIVLKVNGKKYAAKTNSKGKATFKITKLAKKGKFVAKIKYGGSKYYTKATKKVKITVR